MTSTTYKTIEDLALKNNIAHFFALIYNPRDIKNKNKFKVGKMEINNSDNTLYINIYGKPRNMDRNKHCSTSSTFPKKNIGGFRIRWNVYENSYKYVLPWFFGYDYYNCPGCCPHADPWEVLNVIYDDIRQHSYLLYTDDGSSIPLNSCYNNLKETIIKHAK